MSPLKMKCLSAAFTFVVILPCGCDTNLKSLDELLLKSWPEGDQTPATLGLAYEEVTFETVGGKRLVGWFVPSVGGNARATVLIHTGMQGNLAEYLPSLPWYAEHGLDAFLYNWQGFGTSEGQRLLVNFEPDTYAAVDYLNSRPEPAARAVVHFGVSLGGAAALGAAAYAPETTIGVIVYGAFDPGELPTDFLISVASPVALPLGLISGAVFDSWATPFLSPATHIDRIRSPILALIAEDDRIVPPPTQLRLFETYPEPKTVIYTFGDHIGAHRTDPDLGTKVVGWIDTLPGLLAPL